MRVRFLADSEWAWRKGEEATIVEVDPDYSFRFWTRPDSGRATWWTEPADVELVSSP